MLPRYFPNIYVAFCRVCNFKNYSKIILCLDDTSFVPVSYNFLLNKIVRSEPTYLFTRRLKKTERKIVSLENQLSIFNTKFLTFIRIFIVYLLMIARKFKVCNISHIY